MVCSLGYAGTLALGHSDSEPAEGQTLWLPTLADLAHITQDGGVLSSPAQDPPRTKPVTHLAQVVKVVLVPDPSVTGLSTVRFVGDVPGVLTLTHEELPLEELDIHMWEKESEPGAPNPTVALSPGM